jgi:hypothetical protein
VFAEPLSSNGHMSHNIYIDKITTVGAIKNDMIME